MAVEPRRDSTSFELVFPAWWEWADGMRIILLAWATTSVLASAQDQSETNAPHDSSNFVVQTVPCSGTLDGFLKIPWGSTAEDVRKAMKGQAGFKEVTPQGVANDLLYVGGKVANLDVKQLQLHFFHGQFAGAAVTFKPTTNDTQTMGSIRDALTQKYGNWFGMTDSPVWKFQDSNTIGLDLIGGEITLSYFDTELSNAEKTQGTTGINPSGL